MVVIQDSDPYPWPFDGNFQPASNTCLMVIDMQGRMVLRKSVRGGQTFSLQQELPVGVYQMSIFEQGQLRHSQKILMTR